MCFFLEDCLYIMLESAQAGRKERSVKPIHRQSDTQIAINLHKQMLH